MNTNQLTIEQAAELVKNSIGDVFSRDAVLSIIGRIKVQESVDMAAVRSMISDHKMAIKQESETHIENNFDELVDYDEAEFRIEGGNELVLDSVGYSTRDYVFRDLAENIIDILLEGCDELEAYKQMETQLDEAAVRADDMIEMLTPNTTSNDTSEVCE